MPGSDPTVDDRCWLAADLPVEGEGVRLSAAKPSDQIPAVYARPEVISAVGVEDGPYLLHGLWYLSSGPIRGPIEALVGGPSDESAEHPAEGWRVGEQQREREDDVLVQQL